ncbi:MAG TPA: hypothetical protein VGC06_24390 [Actinomycetes bacterium]
MTANTSPTTTLRRRRPIGAALWFLWMVFLPWILGTAVWTNSWPGSLRILVGCFVIGWTIASIPRARQADKP